MGGGVWGLQGAWQRAWPLLGGRPAVAGVVEWKSGEEREERGDAEKEGGE